MSRSLRGAIVLLVLLIAVAQPIGAHLRSQAPPQPDANKLGLGPLLGGVLTGAFRPMLMNYLYIRADILAGQGRFDEQVTLFRNMVQLYPNNDEARGFLGWWLAFNSKSEAARPELAWRWAAEGLDILDRTPGQRGMVAVWFMAQCGQNSFGLYRYAGPDWEAEQAIREAAARWTERSWGKRRERFDAALVARGETDLTFGRIMRIRILHAGLIDDWMRSGTSDKLQATVAGLLWIAELFDGLPEQNAAAMHRAAVLQALAAGGFDAERFPAADATDANAAWALGMHRRDETLLRAALAVFKRQTHHEFAEEKRSITAWLDWIAGDATLPPPPTPFGR